jgi:class III poly(R)-hydroxyalkanoic acid synthase PhaE subunit
MSDRDPQSAWLDAWATAQKDLWQRFLGGQAPPAQEVPGLAMFSQFFGQGLPDSSRDLTRKMMEFGEGYLGVAREFWKLAEATQAGSADAANLQRELAALQSSFTEGFSKLYSSGPLGGDLMAAWQKMGAAATGGGEAPAFPGMPALGPLRERQEAMERLGRASLKYQQALGRFGELLSRVSGDAVGRLSKRVARQVQSEQPIGSLRAMYDLWVDAGEEAYAAAAHGPEFAKAQAELNHARMELKAEQRMQVEGWARALDLPTRTELNTILKRLNTLRRRVRELEEELDQLRRAGRP